LFQSVNTKTLAQNYLRKGALISFGYQWWKHDPYPLLIVTDVFSGDKIRGINLHYLTFPYIRNVLRTGGNNQAFSYANIKGDRYITNAFRSYKWNAIRQVRVLDVSFLLNIMGIVRSFDPSQIMAIRRSVQEQLRRATNPAATPSNMNG
jgi:hypothetical protein